MGANLRYIKEIKKDLSDIIQLLNEFVFGGKKIRIFKETETYSQGDFVIKLNQTLGKYELLQCNVTTASGPFIPSEWSTNTVGDFTSGNYVNPEIIQLSQEQPSSNINLLWYQIKSVKADIDENKFIANKIVFISSSEQIVAQDDEPTNSDTVLWFDFTV